MFLLIMLNLRMRWFSTYLEAVRRLEHAVDLDPRNAEVIGDLEATYFNLRRYKETIAVANRALVLKPRDAMLRTYPVWVGVEADANLAPLRATLNTIEAEGLATADVAPIFFQTALREHDPTRAARALSNIPSEIFIGAPDYPFPHALCEGLLSK